MKISGLLFAIGIQLAIAHEILVWKHIPQLMPVHPPAIIGALPISFALIVLRAKIFVAFAIFIAVSLTIFLFTQLPQEINSAFQAFLLIEVVYALFCVFFALTFTVPLLRFQRFSDLELKYLDLVFLSTVSASILIEIVSKEFGDRDWLFRFSVLFGTLGLSVRISKTLYEIALLRGNAQRDIVA